MSPTFGTLFSKLPLELQARVWELCLPARVVEIDIPAHHIVGTSCELSQTTRFNSQPPLITRICRESRRIALFHVDKLYTDSILAQNGPPLISWHCNGVTWACAATDILHMHWSNSYNADFPVVGDPLASFIWLAQKKGMRMSITDCLVWSFDLLNGWFVWDSFFWSRKHEAFDLLNAAKGPYLVVVRTVGLHTGLDIVLQTSLFGLLGEERVRVVGAADKAAIQAYHDLWAKGPQDDQEAASFFDHALQRHEIHWLPHVQAWQWTLEVAWLRHFWPYGPNMDKVCRAESNSIWRGLTVPYESVLPGFDNIERRKPNREDPWVAEKLQQMPQFQPVVMFRLCHKECYKPPRPRSPPVRGRGHGARGGGRGGVSSRREGGSGSGSGSIAPHIH